MQTNSTKGQLRLPFPSASSLRSVLWLLTSFLTGGVIMSVELAASRLYAPYFGASIFVWGSLISAILLALACGSGFGGWIADRCKSDRPMFLCSLLSGLYQLAMIRVAPSLLSRLAEHGEVTGVLTATLILFVPSLIGLALTGPFVIRLLARNGSVGLTAGRIYGISTAGSIGAILLTSFYLIPIFGTGSTLVANGVVACIIGTAGISTLHRPYVLLCALIPFLPLLPGKAMDESLVWETESAYNLVRVVRYGSSELLILNQENSVHSVKDNASRFTGYYYDDFVVGPMLMGSEIRTLVLGMGAGSSIAAIRTAAPDGYIDAVEIDDKVVEAAARHFDLPVQDNRLHVYVADARPWLSQNSRSYDLIQVDLYQGGPYIPFYLSTVEFFEQLSSHLSPNGLLMMNVYDRSDDHVLVSAIGNTLQHVFPSVFVRSTDGDNHIILAFQEPKSESWIRQTLTRAASNLALKKIAAVYNKQLVEFDAPPGTPLFTDNHAPIEQLTSLMLRE